MNINANNVSAIASTPAWCPSWKPWANDQPLEPRCHDHALSGEWSDHRDCHAKPDVILIYQKPDATGRAPHTCGRRGGPGVVRGSRPEPASDRAASTWPRPSGRTPGPCRR